MDSVARRQIALWLFICSAMVFAILVVGGVTRLTHSGLSIVEWKPIVGVIPPLNQSEWDETFEKYKKTPEYQKVNHQMELDEFKGIFFWEYWHRVLGRLIGAVFLLPFLYFWLRRKIDRPLVPKLLGIFVLGGLQGAMGWYMVKSGLVDDPRVSQFRLTAHLSLAFLIFISMMWVALDLLTARQRSTASEALRKLQRTGIMLAILAFYTVVTGGFVAGIRAGKAYNTFPLMSFSSAGEFHHRAVVPQLLQQHGSSAVRSSSGCVVAGFPGAVVLSEGLGRQRIKQSEAGCRIFARVPDHSDIARHCHAPAGSSRRPGHRAPGRLNGRFWRPALA